MVTPEEICLSFLEDCHKKKIAHTEIVCYEEFLVSRQFCGHNHVYICLVVVVLIKMSALHGISVIHEELYFQPELDLTHSQTTYFGLFQSERVYRRQF